MAKKELSFVETSLLDQLDNLAQWWGGQLTPISNKLETREIEPYHISLCETGIGNYQYHTISLRRVQQPTGTVFSFSLNHRDFSTQFPWLIWKLGLTQSCEFAYVANINTDIQSRGLGLASLAVRLFDGMLSVRAGNIDIPLLGYEVDEPETGWTSTILESHGYARHLNQQDKTTLLKIY